MLASTIQFSNNTPHTQSPTTTVASNPTWSKKQHATHKATSAVPDTQQCTNAPYFFKQCETPNSSFSCLTVCCNPTTSWRGCASTQKHCVFHTKK